MKKTIIKGFLALGLLVALGACQGDNFENKFDETATERLQKRKVELRKELLDSEDGWKMTYFTDDKQLGGFTYLFNFLDDRNVKSASDFDPYTGSDSNQQWRKDPLVPDVTEYNIVLGSTVSLVFTEGSYVSLLANNDIFPAGTNLKGQGYRGDFQYLYYGVDSEGINFKTNRHNVDLKFERATKQDWDQLHLNRTMMDVVSSKRSLIASDSGVSTTYNFRYTKSTRYATVLTTDRTMSINANGGIGIGFTPNSIKISPAIEFEDGSSLSELVLEGNRFVGEVNGNTVILQ